MQLALPNAGQAPRGGWQLPPCVPPFNTLTYRLFTALWMVAFALAGLLFTRGLWGSVALLLPVAWAGVWVGNKLQAQMPPTMLARIIAAVLCVTGVSLIVRTL